MKLSLGGTVAVLLAAIASTAPAQVYRLAPGDVIDVIVPDEPELSSPPTGILIAPDGRIGVPTVGSLEAAGKTCDEVAEVIRKSLEGRVLVNAQVLVRVQKHNQGVSVLGFVTTPGRVPLLAGAERLSQVLAAAGGVVPSAGSMTRVIVTRATGEVVQANLTKVLNGEPDADIAVGPGDVVYVPPTEEQANVFGYVLTPGRYTLTQGERVSDLIARAGGPLVGRAEGAAEGDLSAVVLMRADGATQKLDLSQALADRSADEANPAVQPGDAVFVPELRLTVSVLGQVVSPGRLPLKPGDRISDALAAAGGPLRATQVPAETTGADLANSTLYRASGEVVPLHLNVLYENPQAFNDLPLEPGDVIIVPEGHNRVEVAGYVRNPAQYVFRPGDTVRAAIAFAGGPTPNVGSTSLVQVRHTDGTEQEINVEVEDPPLRPGDVVTVPYERDRVAVVGYVVTPGIFDWHDGDTVVDLIARAGGPRPPAPSGMFRMRAGHPTRAVILRREGDQDKTIVVNLDRFYKKGDRTANPVLQPRDVLLVPAKGTFDLDSITRDMLLLPGLLGR